MSTIMIPRLDGSELVCDLEKRTLSYFRYNVKFTNSEWIILKELYEHKGEMVTRERLVELIWGGVKLDKHVTRAVDVHISGIRKKLAYIKGAKVDAVYGEGYKLVMLRRF